LFIIWPICSNDYASKSLRRASKFCAKRRVSWLTVFFLSLISYVIPGKLEPWAECQLELILDLQPKTTYRPELEFIIFTPTNQQVQLAQSLNNYYKVVEVWKMRAVVKQTHKGHKLTWVFFNRAGNEHRCSNTNTHSARTGVQTLPHPNTSTNTIWTHVQSCGGIYHMDFTMYHDDIPSWYIIMISHHDISWWDVIMIYHHPISSWSIIM